MKRAWLLALVAISMAGCVARDFATNNRADVILRMTSVEGAGGSGGTTAQQLFSDVVDCSKKDANGDPICSEFNDNALMTMQVVPKNPTATLSNLEDVVLTTYTVEYLRADGRGVEGVDVPFAISGNVTGLITVGGESTIPIIVVRHQAKVEPPLRNFQLGGTSVFLTVSAKVSVYGRTTSGKEVSATGYLEIVFANFADEA